MSTGTLPVKQKTLMDRLLPVIRNEGGYYRKYQRVHARSAIESEVEAVDEIDVGVVELLAGYYSANQPGRDIKLRLDAAQHLADADRPAAASAIVKPPRTQDLKTIDRTRLERLELKY